VKSTVLFRSVLALVSFCASGYEQFDCISVGLAISAKTPVCDVGVDHPFRCQEYNLTGFPDWVAIFTYSDAEANRKMKR